MNCVRLIILCLCICSSLYAVYTDPDLIITNGSEQEIFALLKDGYDYRKKTRYLDQEYSLLAIATIRNQLEVITYAHTMNIPLDTPIAEGKLKG